MCILASFNLLKNRLIFKTWGNDRVSRSGRVSWDDPQSLLGFLSIWDFCQLFSMDSLYLTMGEGIYDFQKVILGLQSSLQLFHNFQNLHFYSTFLSVSCSVVSDSATPQTVAHQAPQSMGFSRQEYWSGLPCPSPRDLPDPGIEPKSPAWQADSLPFELQGSPEGMAVQVCFPAD